MRAEPRGVLTQLRRADREGNVALADFLMEEVVRNLDRLDRIDDEEAYIPPTAMRELPPLERLCATCGHPESRHTGSWEQTGLKWDDRVRHPGGCSVGWIDENDVGCTCTCKEFRPTESEETETP